MDYLTASSAYEYGNGDNYVILIHGFPSIPYDLIPLGEYLAQQGFHVIGVKLPGFGHSKEMLLKYSDWKLWYGEINHTIAKIRKRHPKKIFVAGISMGGAAALYTASEHPEIAAVVNINGPVIIKGFSHHLVGIFSKFIKYFEMNHEERDIAVLNPQNQKDPIVAELHRRYEEKGVLPAVATEVKWFRKTAKNLSKITQPLLICQSKQDSIVWLKNPEYILSKVKSQEKSVIWYPHSDHDIIRDYDHEQCMKDISEFFQTQLQN